MRAVDTVYHWGGLHNSTNPYCFRQRPCRRKGGRSARGGREEPPSPVPPQKPLSLGLGFPRFPRPFLHNIYVDETTSSLTFQEGALLLLSVCPREKSTSPQPPAQSHSSCVVWLPRTLSCMLGGVYCACVLSETDRPYAWAKRLNILSSSLSSS